MKQSQLAKAIILIATLYSLASCAAFRGSKLMSKTSTQSNSFKAVTKAEINMDLMIVKVEINGKFYRFLWDTGAICVIDEKLQKELGFKKQYNSKVRDSGNRVRTLKYVKVPELKISNIPFYNVGAVVANLHESATLNCLNLDGIIGGNLMKAAHWQMDLEKNQLMFSNELDSLNVDTTNSSVIEFIIRNNGTPWVEVFSDTNKMGYVTFDSGFAGFYSASSNKFPVTDPSKHPFYPHLGYNSSGLYGTSKSLTTRQKISISIDSVNHYSNVGSLIEGKKPLIGIDFMKQYNITIDWIDQKMYLLPIENKKQDPTKLRTLLPKMVNEQMVLGRIYQTEELKELDCSWRVKEFNGKNFYNLSRKEYCNYLNNLQDLPDTVSIILESGRELKSVVLEVE